MSSLNIYKEKARNMDNNKKNRLIFYGRRDYFKICNENNVIRWPVEHNLVIAMRTMLLDGR